MQHHARQRPARSFAPVRATPFRAFQQPLRLQETLRPGVTPPEPMVANQVLVKMTRREAAVACDTDSRLRLPDRPEPVCLRPAQADGPTAQLRLHPRNADTSAGTSVR